MSASVDILTYRDAVDWLTDYRDANPSAMSLRDQRRAVYSALRILPNAHAWSYFYQQGRVNTVGPFTDGTITYDHTGGDYERVVTLSGNTEVFPHWAAFGVLTIGNVMYQVAERRSDTQLQLSVHSNIGSDITTATSFTLFRDTYTLPADFIKADQMYTPESWRRMSYVHPREWLVAHRYNVTSSNTPYHYTITGSPDFQNCMAVRFYPFPDRATSIDFIYMRRPRQARIEDYHAGTVTIDSGDVYADGQGTVFTDDMVGSIFRVSDTDQIPTSRAGANPYAEERMIMRVPSSTQIEVDQPFIGSYSESGYMISDPIDIETGVMITVFLRCCEAEFGKIARLPDRQELQAEYLSALEWARAADRRSTAPRSVYTEGLWTRRLAYMPTGNDVD
jgi:hypothetical protein